MPEFTDKFYDMSQGDEPTPRGPWNKGTQWELVDDREQQSAVDGGDGSASVALGSEDEAALEALKARGASRTDIDPVTGADLGAGPGAGKTKPIVVES